MRLLELALHRYGAFTERRVPLGAGLTLVVGSNEAGKSTALEAFSDLLWGIPRGSTADFQHGRPRLSLSGEVSLDGALPLRVHRDAKRLTDGAGVEIVAPWAAETDHRARWRTAFGLSHADLREGGQALCAGGGDLAELVFTARSGQSLRGLLEAVADEADQLWKAHRNVKNVTVRRAHKEYEALLERADAATSRASTVEAAREAALRSGQDAARATEALDTARALLDLLLGRGRAVGHAARVAATDAALGALAAQGVVLSSAHAEVVDAAVSARQGALTGLAGLLTEAQEVTERLDALEVDDALLADGDGLRLLVPVSEARDGDRRRSEELSETAAALRRSVASALAGLGVGLGPEDLPRLEVGVGLAADLDSLAADLADALGLVQAQEAALESARDSHARALEGAETLPVDAVSAVREALHAVRAEGSAAQRLLVATEDLADARRRRSAQLASAGLSSGAQVPAAWPHRDAVTAVTSALTQAVDAAARATSETQRCLAEVDAAQQGLADTGATEHTPQRWIEARAERTRRLDEFVQAWLSGTPASAHPGLAVQLERAVQAADDAAEGLVAGADLRARAQEALARLVQARSRHTAAVAASDASRALVADAQQQWAALWSATVAVAPSPVRAEETLVALEAAREADLDVARHELVLSTLAPLRDAQAAGLALTLAAAGRARPDADLDALLTAGDDLLAQADAAREQRSRAETRAADVRRLESRLADAQKVHDEVLAAWRSRITASGLDVALLPAGWKARQEAVARAASAEAEALAADAAALAAGARHREFAAAVNALAASHGTAATSHQEVLRELAERLRQAERGAQERTALARQRTALATSTATLDASVAECVQVLTDLAREVGVPDEDTLVEAAARSSRAQTLQVERTQLLAAIGVAVPGSEPDVLAAELAGLDAAELAEETAAARAALAAREQEQQAALVRSGECRRELAELSRGDGAAALHAEAQGRLAAVAEAAERWVTAEVQRRVLTAELADYESLHASPLLEAASGLLHRLTDGRWTSLERAATDGARELVVVGADGSRLHTPQLSEGTADQVFLALRLAGIAELQRERVTAGLPSLPVVLDDVLMTFDDRRAATALTVLAELSADWQVVVFSHHQHLTVLPLPADARERLTVTMLPSPLSLVDAGGEVDRQERAQATGTVVD